MRDKPNVHRVWSSTELFGSPITALASWTTARFHRDNPKHVAAFVAAIRDAIELIRTDKAKAAGIYLKAEPSKLPADFFAKVLDAKSSESGRFGDRMDTSIAPGEPFTVTITLTSSLLSY